MEIAKRHLLGRQFKDHGLKDGELTVTDAASGEVIAEDDDGGDELNSRVRIRGVVELHERGRPVLICERVTLLRCACVNRSAECERTKKKPASPLT